MLSDPPTVGGEGDRFYGLLHETDMIGEWRDMVRNCVLEAHRQLTEESVGTADEPAYEHFTDHQVADAILPPSEAAPGNGLKL